MHSSDSLPGAARNEEFPFFTSDGWRTDGYPIPPPFHVFFSPSHPAISRHEAMIYPAEKGTNEPLSKIDDLQMEAESRKERRIDKSAEKKQAGWATYCITKEPPRARPDAGRAYRNRKCPRCSVVLRQIIGGAVQTGKERLGTNARG